MDLGRLVIYVSRIELSVSIKTQALSAELSPSTEEGRSMADRHSRLPTNDAVPIMREAARGMHDSSESLSNRPGTQWILDSSFITSLTV